MSEEDLGVKIGTKREAKLTKLKEAFEEQNFTGNVEMELNNVLINYLEGQINLEKEKSLNKGEDTE